MRICQPQAGIADFRPRKETRIPALENELDGPIRPLAKKLEPRPAQGRQALSALEKQLAEPIRPLANKLGGSVNQDGPEPSSFPDLLL